VYTSTSANPTISSMHNFDFMKQICSDAQLVKGMSERVFIEQGRYSLRS